MQIRIALLCATLFGIANSASTAASAAQCTTQSQLTEPQRNALSGAAHDFINLVQVGDVPGLQAKTLPAVASDFSGIASSAQALKPLIGRATITVNALYMLDASSDPPGQERTQFFCGTPIVVLTFNALPPGVYALAILRATGVPNPQQISLILARTPDNHWQLAGFYAKPMVEAGHDGLWYWTSARKYAQTKMDWDAFLYYRLATQLLAPLDFLSSPNLQKLQHEAEQVKPQNLPQAAPVTLNGNGATFQVTAVDTTSQFGPLDLDLHYIPDPTQTSQLRNPIDARKQVTEVMTAVLAQHPEVRQAFHGIWVHADQGNTTLFALELPMDGITAGQTTAAPNQPPAAR